jgi:hypothetical protein
MEQWKTLRGFRSYSVSDQGRVRRNRDERIVAIGITKQRRPYVKLMRQGLQVTRGLALLVCDTFVPLSNPRFENPTPIHLDGNTTNCRAKNLTWRPRWFALEYTAQFARSLNTSRAVRNVTTGIEYADVWAAVIEHGLLFDEILLAICNKTPVFPTWHSYEWVDPD